MLLRAFVLTLLCLTLLAPERAAAQAPPAEAPAPRDRAFLGLYTEEIPDTQFGIRVTHTVPESAAQEIGLEINDVVLAVNDVLLDKPATLREELQGLNIGSTLRFLIERGGEKTKLRGKIGSYGKTMTAYQETVRKRTLGKPFQAPPQVRWLDAESKSWKDDPTALEKLRGNVTIVFSFDDCQHCLRNKFQRFTLLDKQLSSLGAAAPMKVAGIYFHSSKSTEESYKTMNELLAKSPVTFPIGVAYYSEGEKPKYEEQVLLHRHGVAILDTAGLVSYIQVHGVPGEAFVKAYQSILKGAPSTEKPSE